MANEGEVRVRNVRTAESGGLLETVADLSGKVVRMGVSVAALPLVVLPRDSRAHLNNAVKEAAYAFARLPRDFAEIAGTEIEAWAKDAGVNVAASGAPRDEMASY